MKCGKIVISGLRGGSGKTLLSVGIIAALIKKRFSVAPFKKGPDYIDAGWLAYAAGRPCFNLDTYIIPEDQILTSFFTHAFPHDIAVIEGNRGLFDCIDIQGETSTGELAKLLHAPVILSVDCTKTTRTMAAMISGLTHFDPDVRIGGVILNHVAGLRHEQILRKSIEHHCRIPVIGALPKIKDEIFPERHMGLVPTAEYAWAMESIEKAAGIALQYIDLDALLEIAFQFADDSVPLPQNASPVPVTVLPALKSRKGKPRIGIIKDAAFQFYYPENIDALIQQGAQVQWMSPLSEKNVLQVDALYIGGGFPETHAGALAENETFRLQIRQLAEQGLPIYAECGGLMYLGETLKLGEISYPMAGVLPIVFGFSKKPQGHGYTIVSVEKPNPFFEVGTRFRGHEFHYSKVLQWDGGDDDLVFHMERGAGFIRGKDGVCRKNVLATYTHIHALGLPAWAKSMVSNALSYKTKTRLIS